CVSFLLVFVIFFRIVLQTLTYLMDIVLVSFYYHRAATFFCFFVFNVLPVVNIIIYGQTLTPSDYTLGMFSLPFHLFYFIFHMLSYLPYLLYFYIIHIEDNVSNKCGGEFHLGSITCIHTHLKIGNDMSKQIVCICIIRHIHLMHVHRHS